VTADPESVTIRAACAADIPELIELINEHTAYEKAPPPSTHLAERLPAVMFAADAKIHAFVAETSDGLIGYATCSVEASTWQANHYLHLDCLYLRPTSRGGGIGTRLLLEVTQLARQRGLQQVQWQTPEWNESAIRFYERTGARSDRKRRYVLEPEGA
jgi:ribosomal protein S18 acetylase RimI-like enzyme